MKLLSVLACVWLCYFEVSAQSTNKVWAFGWGCGLDFNTNPPTPFLTRANAYEGCSSVSDATGQLLMYVTGDTVYNRNNLPMPNGGDLVAAGGPILGSCSQGSVIVPKPGSSTQYYVFALQGITDGLVQGKLFYHVVDMTLDGGMGDVVPGQKQIQIDAGLSEKLTAVAGTCNNIWVIVCLSSGTEFHAYEVTASGLNPTPVISPLVGSGPGAYDFGVLKGSHNGKKLISANFNAAKYQLFDFDNAQGILSNPIDIADAPSASPYSACFSPDDSKLYLMFDSIYQYDVSLSTATAINNSRIAINSISVGNTICGDMQTGPDGKLYISKLNASTLASIDFPNNTGVACGFNPYAVSLPTPANIGVGLPNAVVNAVAGGTVIQVHNMTICNTTSLSSSASGGPYLWSTGATSASIQVGQGGVYWVKSSAACSTVDTFHISFIGGNQYLNDVTVCTGDSIYLPISLNIPASATVLWNTGNTQPSILIQSPGIYWIEITNGPCVERDSMVVQLKPCGCDFFLPDVFSPNGDGLNDFFTAKYLSVNCTGSENFVLQIFNRWGEKVYWGTQRNSGWDGNYKNQPSEIGTYMFLLNYVDGKGEWHMRKGDVTLVR